MRKNYWKSLSAAAIVAGVLAAGSSVTNATLYTFTGGGNSIDFNDATNTFTNFKVNSVDQLGGSSIVYTGLPALGAPGSISVGSGTWSTASGLGTFSVNFTQAGAVTDLNVGYLGFDGLQTVTNTNGFLALSGGSFSESYNGGTNETTANGSGSTFGFLQVVSASDLAGSPVVPSVAVSNPYDYTFNFSPTAGNGGFLSVDTQLTQRTPSSNAIPEPISALLGISSMVALGLCATSRRTR